jgi:hypothetical protein
MRLTIEEAVFISIGYQTLLRLVKQMKQLSFGKGLSSPPTDLRR